MKPTPFCILDEIEAALDDANVYRYAEFLKEFSKNTQFIVITHRKGTMEASDVIYGVTMEEKGVSKVVSVDLTANKKNRRIIIMFGKLFNKLKDGLSKTRDGFTDKINEVLKLAITIDDDLYEELEEVLIMADIGMDTTVEIIDRLKDKIRKEKINEVEMVYPALKEVIKDMLLEGVEEEEDNGEKKVLLVIGVNGVGKTTSIGKLAAKNKEEGKKVLLAAADTFRAAAIDQLEVWSQRANVELIKHEEGSDPAAVVFDAIQAAKARNADLLICDTAGRLHNKKNLMNELSKINRIIDREFSEAKKETLLVLDGTTGQNAIIQAKQFMEACPIDGIILTKLDGTARGGVVISIKQTLNIPVRYIGVGEGIDDLQEFDAESFAEALF